MKRLPNARSSLESCRGVFRAPANGRRTLDEGQLFLHYRPQMALGTSRIAGLKALLRWQHPHRGLAPLLEFIPLAEESGVMDSIGKFVFQEACRQQRSTESASAWR